MKDFEQWTKLLLEVIARATAQLPEDVTRAIRQGRTQEAEGSLAAMALDAVLKNAELACNERAPMCQDTGVPHLLDSPSSGSVDRYAQQGLR
jgi:tartrate dehydratase alpha subunit/fumarate hydratase class I-like protein